MSEKKSENNTWNNPLSSQFQSANSFTTSSTPTTETSSTTNYYKESIPSSYLPNINVPQPQNNNGTANENFTVLSDGYGNYLRVFHNNEDNTINFNNPNNKYQLFSSSNNFMQQNYKLEDNYNSYNAQQQQQPASGNNPASQQVEFGYPYPSASAQAPLSHLHHLHQQQQQQLPPQQHHLRHAQHQYQPAPPQPSLPTSNLFNHLNIESNTFHANSNNNSNTNSNNNNSNMSTEAKTNNSTNMLINQLVGNWTPNISGTYSPFGESSSHQMMLNSEQLSSPNQNASMPTLASPYIPPVIGISSSIPSPANVPKAPTVVSNTNSSPPPNEYKLPSSIAKPTPIQKFQNDGHSVKMNANNNNPNATNKKQRIVAEVKPMRMSYSAVLIKNTSPDTAEQNGVATSISSSGNIGIGGGTGITNNQNNVTPLNSKANKMQNEKNKNNYNNNNAHLDKSKSTSVPYSNATDDKDGLKNKRNQSHAMGNSDKSSAPMDSNKKNNNVNVANNSSGKVDAKDDGNAIKNPEKKKNSLKKKENNNSRNNNSGSAASSDKKSSNIRYDEYDNEIDDDEDADDDDDEDMDEDSFGIDDGEADEDENAANDSSDYLYNVRRNVNYDNHNIEKIPTTEKKTNNQFKKTRFTSLNRTNSKQDKSSIPAMNSHGKRNYTNKAKKNSKYQVLMTIFNIWLEYMIKILTWLWSLISDVVYLSFGIIWDKLSIGYQYCQQSFVSIKNEIRTNSGRPNAWLKDCYKKFDSKFVPDSKWALWRKIFNRKKANEPVKDYYKDGRLPTTADEAMHSLLNCKGKNAYSILGVTNDCSQEQIRKHYKKIAVLVHPDKNKQAGAEEAFKILQRSFELIGEPDNRKAYDQSIAEEKAWSELNDLLTELQTKISEAANTIRCSSCCLRHPRKPTGRPHYAARECGTCKIRHSAREGDIWAESTFFGIRWKYLALMEGNVYDITEWANCQKGALSHLQPNSHIVQYRIVLGGNGQQEKEKLKKETTAMNDNNLDDLLTNIYGGQKQQNVNSSRRRHKKN